MSFEDPLEGLTKHFAIDENIVMSHFIVVLSSMFPPGEDFFVRSVRAFREQITDPALKRRVAAFIGQEAVHGREHRALNERLDDLGYQSLRISSQIEWVTNFQSRHLDKRDNLAGTAAVEHFTAVLGELLLTTDLRDCIGHDGMKSVFMWHALEECEHKAVAFDLYSEVVGDEARRVRVMKLTRLGFCARVAVTTTLSLLSDRATYRRGRLRRDLKSALGTPLFSRKVWRALREYDRKGFHPNDINTDQLVVKFRDELFGPEGTLTRYLTNSTNLAVEGLA